MDLTFGSLFAGVGGFDLGMESVGWQCKFQVEWDKKCQQVLARHWPTVPRWGDVSTVNGAELPPVDCITFGSPCQDLSIAGKHAGLSGERSGLFHEAIRIIKEMRDATGNQFPKWGIWENVVGALSSNKGADFQSVLGEMADIGAYLIEWHILDAQWFGVPQRRRRVFVIACFDSATASLCPDSLLPVGARSGRDSAARKEARKKASFGVGASIEINGATTIEVVDAPDVSPTVTSKWAKGYASGIEHGNMIVVPISSNIIGRQDHNGGHQIGIGEPGDPMFTLTSGDRHAVAWWDEGQIADTLTTTSWNQSMPDKQRFQAVVEATSLVYDPQVVGTLTTYGSVPRGTETIESNHVIAVCPTRSSSTIDYRVRRITPLECERLQGWPDDHTRWEASGKEQADTVRFKQIGNGVASPVAAWIGLHIAKVMNGE